MAQTLTRLLVHVVFSTKDRAPLIEPETEPDLYAYIGGIANALDSALLAAGGFNDHLHLLLSLSKNHALANVVMHVKKDSSRWMKARGVRNFGWQDGYAGVTIGESGIAAVRRYFAGQKEHHRKRSFQDELRAILRRHDLPFDERYIWA